MPEAQEARALMGENLRKIREDRGLSQSQLADRMTERGFKWSPTTVADVEKARRGLQTDELLGAALCLASSPAGLLAANVPVTIGNVTVDDPGIFNMWVQGRVRLWVDEGELLVLQRPKDVLTSYEFIEQNPGLFLSEDEYEAERRRRRKEGK